MNEKKWEQLKEFTKEDETKLKTLFDKERKEMLETFEASDEELDELAMNRVYVIYKKARMGLGGTYEGYIRKFGAMTDFGAKKVYEDIKKKFDNGDDSIKKALFDEQMVDEEGNPLWSPKMDGVLEFKYNDRKGKLLPAKRRIIDPEKESRRMGVGILKKEGEEEYKVATITLHGSGDVNIPTKKKISIKLGGRYDEKNDIYRLGVNMDNVECEILDEKEMTHEDFVELVEKGLLKKYLFDFSEPINNWADENDNLPFVVLKGMCIRTVITDGANSNIVNMGSMNFMDEEENISCFFPDDLDVPIEGSVGVYVTGTLNTKGDNVTMNVIDCQEKKFFEKPNAIKPEENKKEEEKPKEKPSWLK